jgi:rfaE bifunctional protein nucleotidyltransferase chain/domain
MPKYELPEGLKKDKAAGKKIVFTNGCFDLLHPGHVEYLKEAKKWGNVLVIGLNSDSSVRALKGPERPITEQNIRKLMLEALKPVDYVITFYESTPIELMKVVIPDVYIKGSDYKMTEIPEGRLMIEMGKEAYTVQFVAGFSSTNIINKIKNLNSDKK